MILVRIARWAEDLTLDFAPGVMLGHVLAFADFTEGLQSFLDYSFLNISSNSSGIGLDALVGGMLVLRDYLWIPLCDLVKLFAQLVRKARRGEGSLSGRSSDS